MKELAIPRNRCRCCTHARRDELELEARAAARAPDADARLAAVSGRFGVSELALRRHVERHELLAVVAERAANLETLRRSIDDVDASRDVAHAMLGALADHPEALARLVAHVPSSGARTSRPNERTARPSLARAAPRDLDASDERFCANGSQFIQKTNETIKPPISGARRR